MTQPVASQPAAASVGQLDPRKQYSILGAIARPGTYSVADQQEANIRQAIAAAGGLTAGGETITVTVVRRDAPGHESKLLDDVPVDDLFSGAHADVVIRPGDMIIVSPPVSGEYYMGGEVPRTGVYSLTGRKISLKQAIVAAGGLEKGLDDAYICIIRRVGADREDYPVWNLRYSDMLSGKAADVLLKPNDIVRVSKKSVDPPKPRPPAATQMMPAPPATAPAAQRNPGPLFPQLVAEQVAVKRNLNELEQRYGPKHPSVLDTQRHLEIVERQIATYDRDHPGEAVVATAPTTLSTLLAYRDRTREQLGKLESQYGPEHPLRRRLEAELKRLDEMIAARSATLSAEDIGASDPKMREYLHTLDAMELRQQQLGQSVGSRNPTYLNQEADIRVQKQRIKTYAEEYRKHFVAAATQP
jgi:protein involved in polysaccharide export with SLBB domain